MASLNKWRPMNFAYEHIRIKPDTDFVMELMESSFEEIEEDQTGNVNCNNPDATKFHYTGNIFYDVLGEDDESDEGEILSPIGLCNASAVSYSISICPSRNDASETDVGSPTAFKRKTDFESSQRSKRN